MGDQVVFVLDTLIKVRIYRFQDDHKLHNMTLGFNPKSISLAVLSDKMVRPA
jgi:hypothetical protein